MNSRVPSTPHRRLSRPCARPLPFNILLLLKLSLIPGRGRGGGLDDNNYRSYTQYNNIWDAIKSRDKSLCDKNNRTLFVT